MRLFKKNTRPMRATYHLGSGKQQKTQMAIIEAYRKAIKKGEVIIRYPDDQTIVVYDKKAEFNRKGWRMIERLPGFKKHIRKLDISEWDGKTYD